MLTIYLSHPISGVPLPDVFDYYDRLVPEMQAAGYRVLHPMTGKDFLRGHRGNGDPRGYAHPTCTAYALACRDRWMVQQADVVYADLTGAALVSIGCCFELAWATDGGQHVVVAADPNSPHHHAFVLHAAHVLFASSAAAVEYLKALAAGISRPLQIVEFVEAMK